MGLTATIAGRNLKQHPGRTFFSVMGIAVGIATVVGIFALDHNTVLGRGASRDAEWQAEIQVSPSARVERPREELAELPGVTDVTATFQHDVALYLPGQAEVRPTRAHLVALEAENARALGAYVVETGRDLGAGTTEREVLLGENLAAALRVGVGDELLLSRPPRAPRKECIDGTWQVDDRKPQQLPERTAFEVVGLLGRDGLGRKSRGHVVVVDYARGRELFQGAHLQTRYWLKHAPDFNLEDLETNLGRAYSYDLKKSVIVGQAADERAFRNGVRFAGLLAMVLGLFVIFHTLSMSLLERMREVGALHALGATRGQVARIFMCEAAIIAGLGGALGLAGGLLWAGVLLRVGVTTVGRGRPMSLVDIPWGVLLPLTAVGVVIALLGSVYPLVRARNTSVVDALRGEETGQAKGVARGFQIFAALLLAGFLPGIYFVIVPVVGTAQAQLVGVIMIGVGILAVFVTLPLVVPSLLGLVCAFLARPFERAWPLAGKLAGRSMSTGHTRVSGAVAAIALVTAGFVGLRGMTESLEAEIEVWGQEAFLNKVYVRHLPKLRFDAVEQVLSNYPGVLGVEPGDVRTYVPFLLVGADVEQLAGWGPCREDPALLEKMRGGRGLILSRRLAGQNDKQVGDLVHVRTSRGAVESLPVLAVSDAYGYFPHPDERLYAVVGDSFMADAFCIDTEFVTSVAVRLEKGTPYNTVETAIRNLLPSAEGLSFETGPYLYRWHTTDIRRDFILFDIILGLTALLAGIGVLNGQLLAALERAKELGVLKALGTTRRQVAGMVFLEAAVVGVLGGGLGVALGTGLTPVIVEALQVISSLPLPSRGAGLWALWAWLGAVLIAGLAGLYPVWRMNRLSAVAAVRTGG